MLHLTYDKNLSDEDNLQRFRSARGRLGATVEEMFSGPMNESQTRSYERKVRQLDELDEFIDELELRVDLARRSDVARRAAVETGEVAAEQQRSGGVGHTTPRESTYSGRNDGPSYFHDQVTLALRGYDPDAAERMQRHSREVSAQMQTRALTTTDGAGGEAVPPMWMVDKFIELARAGRVTADRMNRESLPGGTDSLNIPKMATGTAVAEQATQNTAVQNTDLTTTSVQAAVATLAGQQVVSLQLFEQSPINIDNLILSDLAADYATKLDLAVINNNAAGKRGILNTSGINAVTYTDASPTVGELYLKVADAIQRIHTARFLPPDAIIMHPRRWAWFIGALDSSGRPLVVPNALGPYNAFAGTDAVVSQGFVGSMQGLPVYVDPNIPTNLGAGTNEDRVIIGRFDDAQLYEGTPRAETFRETKADQLSALIRFYNYVAWTFERYPAAYSVVAGTGLVTPTW